MGMDLFVFLRFFLLFSLFVYGLWFFSDYYHRLMQRYTGKTGLLVTGLIGVPFHEIAHAVMALLFGHKIHKIVFFRYKDTEPTLGWVVHSYNPFNLHSSSGILFIATAPLILIPPFIGWALNSINVQIGQNITQLFYDWITLSTPLTPIKLFYALILDIHLLLNNVAISHSVFFSFLALGCIAIHAAPSRADIRTIPISLPTLLSAVISTVFIYIMLSTNSFTFYLNSLIQVFFLSIFMSIFSLIFDLSGSFFLKLLTKLVYTDFAKRK